MPRKDTPRDDGVESAFTYDPFAVLDQEEEELQDQEEEDSEEEASAETTEEEGDEEEEEASSEEEKEPEKPAAKSPTQEDINEAVLQGLRNIQSSITSGKKEPAQPTDEVPSYAFQMDPRVIQALRGEDEGLAGQALAHVIDQIGQVVHRRVRDEYREHTSRAVQDYYSSQVRRDREQTTIETDFYGKYPKFNTPAGRSIVQAATQDLVRSGRIKEWSPSARDLIGETAEAYLKQLVPEGQNQQTVLGEQKKQGSDGKKTPGKRRPGGRQTKPGARSEPNRPAKLADEVSDTLFGRD